MRAGLVAIVIVIIVAVVAVLNSLFIVNPTQQALVLQFGEVRQAIRDPGLHMKMPVVQDVVYLDKRVLDLNVPSQEIIASDQKRLVVDAFTRYRIANPLAFYQATQGGSMRQGQNILSTRVQSNLRAVLAEATFTDIVRDDRPELMQQITDRVAAQARALGIEVVDVRIRRADLPEANSEAIYARMQTEREQEAREIRAQGQEAAQRVRAAADRTATVVRAEANRESEQIRGQGDARRNAIFADAYGQDPNFFAFYRAMQAYEQSLAAGDTRLVLSPDADFFRYFNDPFGGSVQEAAASDAGSAGAIVPPVPGGAVSIDNPATVPSPQSAATGGNAASVAEDAAAARKALDADVAAAEAQADAIEEQVQSSTTAAEAEAAAVAATNPDIGDGTPAPGSSAPASADTASTDAAAASTDTASASDAAAATPADDAEAAETAAGDAAHDVGTAVSDEAAAVSGTPSPSGESAGDALDAAAQDAETAAKDAAAAVEGEVDQLTGSDASSAAAPADTTASPSDTAASGSGNAAPAAQSGDANTAQ